MKSLAFGVFYPLMTLKADDRKRVTLPCAKPGQVYEFREGDGGQVILTPTSTDSGDERPFDPHLYDDLRPEELELQKASARTPQQAPIP